MSGWDSVWAYHPVILDGLWVTIKLSAVAAVASTALGFAIAVAQIPERRFLRLVLRIYTDVLRGTPLIVQLLIIYFGGAYIGVPYIATFAAAAVSISLYYSAYVAEVFKAGFGSVPSGQREAAHVLGLSFTSTMQRVIVPQSLAVSRGPLVGLYVSLIKDTSIATIIGLPELVKAASTVVNQTAEPGTVYLLVAVLYFIICYPLSLTARYFDTRARWSR
ncbi:amino acid ABC transporter permease [Rhodococcus qingshengii]|uniref:amino acid ABC transporter permease n=1 Tax=Rhodococcus qingshengii TaxID=334542 RepID=UPI0036D7EDEE